MNIFLLRVALASEKQQEETLQILRLLVGPTEVQPGCLACCLACRVHQEAPEQHRLLLLEEWDSRDHLEEHIRSDDFRKILAVMDMASEPPKVEFHMDSHIRGMDFIREVLSP